MTENFSFKEIQIASDDIEELMGFEPGTSPAPFPQIIETGLNLASELCMLTGGYQIYENIVIRQHTGTIEINEFVFNPGKTVTSKLKNASKIALFVCTAGAKISEYAHEKSAEGDDLLAYVLDIIGSVAADKAATCLLNGLQETVSASGLGITDSFSPGYCNWNVAEQRLLFGLLPSGFCNISLSGSSMMHPVKSISGITGIGYNCVRTDSQCKWCPDMNCIYGKIRRSKKAKKNL